MSFNLKFIAFIYGMAFTKVIVRAQLDLLHFEQPAVYRHVAKLGPDGYLTAASKCDRISVDVGFNKGRVSIPW
jgi:hypothetical protein